MMPETTSLRVEKETNINLMIVSRLVGKTKESLAQEILQEGLKPYLAQIKRQKFR